jgi:ATP-binding cassette, subfamily F, member 3
LLGRFLFKGEEAFKAVRICSGGEKSRLALARLVLGGYNLLLLDEPTNHMDLPAQEAMADAFASFEGSLLCISHDRAFIQAVATDIWELYKGEIILYEGDYDHYLGKRAEKRAAVDARQAKAAAKSQQKQGTTPMKASAPLAVVANATHQARKLDLKAVGKLEKAIAKAEEELDAIGLQMQAHPNDFEMLHALGEQATKAQSQLDALTEQWLELQEGTVLT